MAENKAKPVKKEEKKVVSYYLLKTVKYRTIFRTPDGEKVDIVGKNSVINIRPEDPQYDIKVKYLAESPENKENGGTSFVEISGKDSGDCVLDSLLDLAKDALFNLLEEPEMADKRLSRGALMMKILKDKGVI